MHLLPSRVVRSIACLAALLVLLLVRPVQAAPQDIDTLVSRLAAAYLAGTSTGSASSYLGSLGTDGCWTDVDYTDQSQTSWKPVTHLSRVRSLAAAYQKSGHALYHDAATLTSIGKALDCWYAKAPKSTNWWHNEIGKQLQLGPIGILLTNELSAARKQKIIDDLQTAPAMTGQNRVWISQNVVVRGCLERSESRITTGLTGIKETVVVAAANAEGVQPDYSFHQHGPLLYSAGYGLGFISDTSTWAHHTRGTLFAFSTPQVDVLLGLLLDGDRWMVRGKMFDYSADGREISRPNQSASALIGAAQRLAELAPARATECTALADHIAGNAAAPLAGNRHFSHSDLMAHHRADFYVSVKLASNRTYGTECINQENLKGSWLPFGLTYLARRGDEYENIFPLWDWTHLPGVTSAAVTSCPKAQKAANAFAGGASDGKFGVASMQLNELGTQAHKSWFFFDREVVALGAGISSTRAEKVSTTLNQSLRVGTVTVDGQAQAAGEKALPGVGWVHHDETGYLPLAGTTAFTLRHGSVSGNWKTINAAQSSTTITKDLCALWIDHGIKPQNASYGYAVLPAISTTALASYAQKPAVRVVVNTTARQAVQHDTLGLLGVVFHQAGTVQSVGLTLSVTQPCILLLDTSRAHETRLTVANPLGTSLKIDVDVTRDGQAHHASFDVDGRSQTQTWPQTTVGDAGPNDAGAASDAAKIDDAALSDTHAGRDGASDQTVSGDGEPRDATKSSEGKLQLSGGSCSATPNRGDERGSALVVVLLALALVFRSRR